MRIIAGEFRRRLLLTPRDAATTRPIPDRVKESLFALLRGHCEGAAVFDGFAGTGAIGLEAVSRGATRCVLVEQDRAVADLLRRNVETLGAGDRCEVFVGDALGAGALARAPRPLTLAFLDPPYVLVRDPAGFRRVMSQLGKLVELLTPEGFALLRTPWPLRWELPDATTSPVPTERRFRKRRRSPRHRDWETDDLSSRRGRRPAQRDDAIDVAAAEPEESTELAPIAAEPQTATPPPPPPDLHIPNAAGPETHVYGAMAVHLYMKRTP